MTGLAWLIISCEIAFWVVIVLGLTCRYMLRLPKTGLVLLALTPVIDLVLLAAAAIDLHSGATATIIHALAAVYIGVSLAFGKSMIAWADARFRYYVAKQGEKPLRKYGRDYARHYFKGWLNHLLAYGIGIALLYGTIWWVQSPERTESLQQAISLWSLIVAIDLLIAASYWMWPPTAKQDKPL